MDLVYWKKKGDEFSEKGQYEDALKCYEKILEYTPNNASILFDIGMTYLNLGIYENALIYADKGLDLNPNNVLLALLWELKGLSYLKLTNISKAIECYETSYNIEPDERKREFIEFLKNDLNTNMQCPNCHTEIDDRYKFCIKCGYDLRNNPNQDPIESLKELVEHFISVAEWIDKKNLEGATLINDFKNNNLSVKLAIINDFIDFLAFLGLGDEYIAPEEVLFINRILGSTFTQKDILDWISKDLDDNYFDKLPISFMLFYEMDIISNVILDKQNLNKGSIHLFETFEIMGYYYIRCDGDIDPKEEEFLNKYLANLRRNLDLFRINGYATLRSDIISRSTS